MQLEEILLAFPSTWQIFFIVIVVSDDVIGFVIVVEFFFSLLEATVQTTFLYLYRNALCVYCWIKSCFSPTAILNGD